MWVAGNNAGYQGFTLLELMLVLVIATLMVGLVSPRLVSLIPGVELKSFTQRYAAVLRQANSRAIAQGDVISVAFEPQTLVITTSDKGQVLKLPEGVALRVSNTTNPFLPVSPAERKDAILFYPDGSSSGARLSIRSDAGHYQLNINWLTSRVSIDG